MEHSGIINLIARIREKANRYIVQALHDHGLGELSPSHGDILIALFRNHSLPMKDIARIIDRDKSTVTPLVNKLLTKGYIKKEMDEHDSRVFNISITPKGLELKPLFMQISKKMINAAWADFSPEEKNTTMSFLNRLNQNLSPLQAE